MPLLAISGSCAGCPAPMPVSSTNEGLSRAGRVWKTAVTPARRERSADADSVDNAV
jgi:hypothetical protein